jgi:Peptidase M50B-like
VTAERRADPIESRTLALALLASLLLWNLPFGGVVLYPFKLLATWLHELSHALAMVITGAGVDRVLIYRDTSGLAYASGSASAFGAAVIAAAGYMGTPLWGAILLLATPTARAARIALVGLAVLMVLSVGFVVEPTPEGEQFGPYATLAIAGAIAACGIALPARLRLFCAHFIAAQACINALLDIRVLLRPMQVIDGVVSGHSDAYVMADATFGHVPPWTIWFWAVVWLAWSVAVLFIALRLAARRHSPESA